MMDLILNKYVLAIGSILTPLIATVMNHVQDSFYMFSALMILVIIDTLIGMYIAAKNGKFSSGKSGFWKLGDKLVCYFGLLIIVYTAVFLVSVVPAFTNGITEQGMKYMIVFTFSTMYGREIFSIFESIDKLQPKLLPKFLKDKIAKIFNKEPEDNGRLPE